MPSWPPMSRTDSLRSSSTKTLPRVRRPPAIARNSSMISWRRPKPRWKKKRKRSRISNRKTSVCCRNHTAPEVFATMAQVTSQLRSVKAEIDARNKEHNRLQSELAGYQSRLELSPALEQELSNLTSEYGVTKESYTGLSNEKLSSQMQQD